MSRLQGTKNKNKTKTLQGKTQENKPKRVKISRNRFPNVSDISQSMKQLYLLYLKIKRPSGNRRLQKATSRLEKQDNILQSDFKLFFLSSRHTI